MLLALALNIVLVLSLVFNNIELVHAENTDNGNNNMVVMSEERTCFQMDSSGTEYLQLFLDGTFLIALRTYVDRHNKRK